MTWDDVDEAVSHVLNAMGKVGYLYLVELDGKGYVKEEPGRTEPIKLPDTYAEQVDDGLLAENQDIALEVAEKGAVLLKNDNETLPLDASNSSVGMIGLGAVNPIAVSYTHLDVYKRQFPSRCRAVQHFLWSLLGKDCFRAGRAGICCEFLKR